MKNYFTFESSGSSGNNRRGEALLLVVLATFVGLVALIESISWLTGWFDFTFFGLGWPIVIGSHFNWYTVVLIPSLLLGVLIGFTHLMAAHFVYTAHARAGPASLGAGLILLLWMLLQFWKFDWVWAWSDLAYLLIAVLELILSHRVYPHGHTELVGR